LAISNYKQHLASYLVQNTWNACLCQIAISGNWWPVTNHLAVFFLQFCDAAKVGNHPQSWFSQILAVNKNMKEKSLNILIYIFGYIIGPCIERNLAKFNSYHWLIPNFISLFLSFFLFLSLSLSLRAPSSLVHDHLQSCCSCCCCNLPRLINHSSLTHKHICNINTHTHTHTHTQTNYYNMHTRVWDQQSSI
jgi:hypothetical protein